MARITVIDDVAVNRELLATILKPLGHRVTEAGDGVGALALVHRERPDLIICDILMPEMDGYEFVRCLRADPDIAAIPVVFCSAHFMELEAQQLAEVCGVSKVLTKPVDPQQIIDVVQSILEQGRTARIPEPLPGTEFDRQHLHLLSGKLSEKVAELQGANDKLAALIELNLQLASERDKERLLAHVCQGARALLGAECGTVAVRRTDGEALAHVGHCGLDPVTMARISAARIDGGELGRVYREAAVLNRDVPTDGTMDTGLPAGYPAVRNLLAAPVKSLSTTYGWICLANKQGGDGFTAEDAEVLRIVAAQAGRIYENGSLYAKLQQYAHELEAEIGERERTQRHLASQYSVARRLTRVYAVLSGINSAIVRIHDRLQLFREACRVAVDEGGFGIAWIGEIDPETDEVVPLAWEGVEDDIGAERLSLHGDLGGGPGAVARAVRSGTLCVVNDLGGVDAIGRRRVEARRRGYRSLIALPLIVDTRVVGVLVLHALEADFFTTEEQALLKELANDLSFALEYIARQDMLAYLAYHDVLTGLPNRAHLLDRLGAALQTVRHHAGERVAVVLWDVNRFRNINDTFGRQVGDNVLRELARRFKEVWPDEGTVARITVDQFAGVISGAYELTDIAHLIENAAVSALDKPVVANEHELRITVSAGIAVSASPDDDADALLGNAEAALRKAKGSGVGYLFYGPEMNALIADTLLRENRLRQALERDEFVLYYQPKICGASGAVTGLEALLRWNDPANGLIQPVDFIPILEETGMIVQVGLWAIRKALADMRAWREAGLAPLRVAVNVSPLQLQQPDFVDSLRQVVEGFGDHPVELDLEITESMIMTNVDANVARLAEIRTMGIEIAIDDFGTGYSSLGYLARLPVNALKIDRSFVATMAAARESLTIVSTIISLAHSLDLKVIAEGVEEEGQASALRGFRCNELQGYLISRPLPPEQIIDFVRARMA